MCENNIHSTPVKSCCGGVLLFCHYSAAIFSFFLITAAVFPYFHLYLPTIYEGYLHSNENLMMLIHNLNKTTTTAVNPSSLMSELPMSAIANTTATSSCSTFLSNNSFRDADPSFLLSSSISQRHTPPPSSSSSSSLRFASKRRTTPRLTRDPHAPLGSAVSVWYVVFCMLGLVVPLCLVYINFFKTIFTCPGYVPPFPWKHPPALLLEDGTYHFPLPRGQKPGPQPFPPPRIHNNQNNQNNQNNHNHNHNNHNHHHPYVMKVVVEGEGKSNPHPYHSTEINVDHNDDDEKAAAVAYTNPMSFYCPSPSMDLGDGDASANTAPPPPSLPPPPPLSASSSGGNSSGEDTQDLPKRENPYVVLRTTPSGALRFCVYCNQYKPDNAYHCHQCKHCIFGMDHHCPFVNNCVGRDNTKYFLLFTLYIPIGALHMLITMMYSFFWRREEHLIFLNLSFSSLQSSPPSHYDYYNYLNGTSDSRAGVLLSSQVDLDDDGESERIKSILMKAIESLSEPMNPMGIYYICSLVEISICVLAFGMFALRFWILFCQGETSMSEMIRYRRAPSPPWYTDARLERYFNSRGGLRAMVKKTLHLSRTSSNEEKESNQEAKMMMMMKRERRDHEEEQEEEEGGEGEKKNSSSASPPLLPSSPYFNDRYSPSFSSSVSSSSFFSSQPPPPPPPFLLLLLPYSVYPDEKEAHKLSIFGVDQRWWVKLLPFAPDRPDCFFLDERNLGLDKTSNNINQYYSHNNKRDNDDDRDVEKVKTKRKRIELERMFSFFVCWEWCLDMSCWVKVRRRWKGSGGGLLPSPMTSSSSFHRRLRWCCGRLCTFHTRLWKSKLFPYCLFVCLAFLLLLWWWCKKW